MMDQQNEKTVDTSAVSNTENHLPATTNNSLDMNPSQSASEETKSPSQQECIPSFHRVDITSVSASPGRNPRTSQNQHLERNSRKSSPLTSSASTLGKLPAPNSFRQRKEKQCGRKSAASNSQALLRAKASLGCPSFATIPSDKNRSYSSSSMSRRIAAPIPVAPVPTPGNVSTNSSHGQRLGTNLSNFDIDTQATKKNSSNWHPNTNSPLHLSNVITKGEWKHVEVGTGDSEPPPCERSLHAAAVWKDQMFIFGGYDGERRRNDFYSYNLSTNQWKTIEATSGSPPSPRDRHCAVVYKDSFYIFAGFDGSARVNDFYQYDIIAGSWRRIIPDAVGQIIPTPRHSHSAVVHEDSMWVWGGYDGSYRCDLFQYNFKTNIWTTIHVSGRIPRARYRASFVVHKYPSGPKLILHGGHDGTRHLADTHVFDLETRIWSALISTGIPPVNRDSHVCVVYGNGMYIMGGSAGGSAMNDLHELLLDGPEADFVPQWRKVIVTGSISHRFCHVGAMHHDSLYIFGGFNGSQRLNDFLRFEFNVDDLSYEIPPSTLVSDMGGFVNNEALSDVTFIAEGRELHAHKIMLLRSPYFRAMLTGSMMESNQSIIHIEEIPYDILVLVMQYLYTDSVDISFESAMELFAAADIYDIPRLQAMCEKKMLESIEVGNAASIFLAADAHSANSLRSKALKYILKHFEVVSKSTAFEEMARSNVELVVEILRQR